MVKRTMEVYICVERLDERRPNDTKCMRLCKCLPECKIVCRYCWFLSTTVKCNAADSKSGAYQSYWLLINRRTVWLQLKMSLTIVTIYAHILMDSGIDSSKSVYTGMAHTHSRTHNTTQKNAAHTCINGYTVHTHTYKMLMIEFNRLRILPFWIIFLSVSYIM